MFESSEVDGSVLNKIPTSGVWPQPFLTPSATPRRWELLELAATSSSCNEVTNFSCNSIKNPMLRLVDEYRCEQNRWAIRYGQSTLSAFRPHARQAKSNDCFNSSGISPVCGDRAGLPDDECVRLVALLIREPNGPTGLLFMSLLFLSLSLSSSSPSLLFTSLNRTVWPLEWAHGLTCREARITFKPSVDNESGSWAEKPTEKNSGGNEIRWLVICHCNLWWKW